MKHNGTPDNTLWSVKGYQFIFKREHYVAMLVTLDISQVTYVPFGVARCAVILAEGVEMSTS